MADWRGIALIDSKSAEELMRRDTDDPTCRCGWCLARQFAPPVRHGYHPPPQGPVRADYGPDPAVLGHKGHVVPILEPHRLDVVGASSARQIVTGNE